ncbi:CRE-ACR-7 protein [Caenorhabditis remanei]|uniref:CRE-ACR-7 protein n=1 Tax=Caenorhabditis remanei TaxID=31234 RepID=E3MN31_CAERE|nr:CRE-ACR-7 protein [Caenorhabditis remanei]
MVSLINIIISAFVLFVVFLNLDTVEGSKREAQLYRDLLANYSYLVRPVRNPKKALTVTMKVFIQQVLTVDAKHQMIEVNAWLKYVWTDFRLRWHPPDYENITSVRFYGEDQIWQPDILLYNRYIEDEQESFDITYKTNALVYNDGVINWIPPGIFKLSCKMDITLFPFDEQICFMKFGSWTYHGFALDLRLDTIKGQEPSADLSTYITNGEWHLLAAPARREEKFYKCCREPYPTVKFYLHLRRRTFYYVFNVILPTLLVSFMSLLAFCLPATDLSEKIGLQTTILLSVCFFLTILSEMTPTTSEAVPLLGVFFSALTFIVAISTTFTILVLNIRYRQITNHYLTPFFRSIFLEWLPWCMMMKRPDHKFRRGSSYRDSTADQCVQCAKNAELKSILRGTDNQKQVDNDTLYPFPAETLSLKRKVGDGLFIQRRCQVHEEARSEKFTRGMRACERTLREDGSELANVLVTIIKMYEVMVTQVERIRKRIALKRKRKDIQDEWKFAAQAVDRFCLILFTIVFITLCSIFVFIPPIKILD